MGGVLAGLAQRTPAASAAWLSTAPCGAGGGEADGGADGVWVLRAAVSLCKLERQLLLHGWAHLHVHPEACALLVTYVELLEATEAQQQRLRAAGSEAAGTGAGGAAADATAEALMPLLLLPAKTLMEVQDLQPLAMRDALPRAIAFFLGQLSSRPFSQSDDSFDEKFLVRALTFLRNALSTSAYLPTRQAPPQAHECQQVLHAFFASPSLRQLVSALLTRALPISPDEYDEYVADPEPFVFEEHLARESNSLRKCAERCLLTLADTNECRAQVQAAVLELSNEAASAGLSTLRAVLALDGCYLALGLVLQGAHDGVQLHGVLNTLRSHCTLAAAEHAHLLRRRAAWLLGWMLRTPHFKMMSAAEPQSPGGSGDAVTLMYSMLQELLADEHPGVRLSAALAVQTLFDATDTSPRADPSPRPSLTVDGADVPSDGTVDPLAQLASAALLQVLHLTLNVHEIDSRWRMGQLLCRLLSRLAAAPALLAPHLHALAQWLPTAWAACGEEQLMQEATLDAAATMIDACGSPQLQPPLPLLAAGMDLVALATGGPLDPAGANGAGASGSGAGGAWAVGREPPVGVVELALRLWRGCLKGLRSPLRSELAPQLSVLAYRMPVAAALADELLRPAMLLVDWYYLTDRTLGSCAGGFAASHSTALGATFESALVSNPGGQRRGCLAAISTMHTVLLAAPEHAGALQPALATAIVAIVAPEDGPDAPNDLVLASMAGLLGRALLCAPALFSAAIGTAGNTLQLPDCHAHFAARWVSLVDSIVLSSQRKLAALALVSLLALDAALLHLTPEVLSFCVSVVAEFPPSEAGAAPMGTPPLPMSGEHAEFTRRLAASGLDPLPALSLRPALQEGLRRLSATHGEAFDAYMRALDPSLLQQVQAAFG